MAASIQIEIGNDEKSFFGKSDTDMLTPSSR